MLPRMHSITQPVVRSLVVCGVSLLISAARADLPHAQDKAPRYGDPVSQLGVKNYSKKPIADSLEALASGKKLLLYFWSPQDRMSEMELSALESYRSANPGALKIVAVSFPASGDADNAQGRQASDKHSSLEIVFDDSRQLYSLYCPKDKSESGSAFLVSATGVLTALRVGADRNGDLIGWLTAALGGKAPSPPQQVQPVDDTPRCPEDVKDHVFQYEIMAAAKLGYMTVPDGAHFKPDAPVLAKDFVDCLKRLPSEEMKGAISAPDKPDEPVTREQATKLFAMAVYSREQIDAMMDACDGAPVYLSDFVDGREVSSWAENCFALAVFRGWISDRYRLYPKEQATRGYIASLLARAFPGGEHSYTGLVVHVPPSEFQRAQSLQIVTESADASSVDVLYPDKQHLPPLAYLQSPGMVSYCTSVDDAMARRTGKNPLVVTATDVRKVDGKWQLVLDPADAERARKEDRNSLILRTWRVAVVLDPPPVSRTPEVTAPESDAKTEPDVKPDPGTKAEPETKAEPTPDATKVESKATTEPAAKTEPKPQDTQGGQ